VTDEELAHRLYETWDMYGGRALGNWNQQFCKEAWGQVVDEARTLLREQQIQLSEESR
jgi:hypothetical protein